MLAAALAIVLATVLGLALALLRLSSQPARRRRWRAASSNSIRNTPQLLQIVFWYIAVLQVLPGARASVTLGSAVFLNVRGLFMPAPESPRVRWRCACAGRGGGDGPAAAVAAGAGAAAVGRRCWPGWSRSGRCCAWELPVLRGFNFQGGWRLPPELLALVVGVGIYTSAFIAENIRASIQAVTPGQREAARSLGLSPAGPCVW